MDKKYIIKKNNKCKKNFKKTFCAYYKNYQIFLNAILI